MNEFILAVIGGGAVLFIIWVVGMCLWQTRAPPRNRYIGHAEHKRAMKDCARSYSDV